MESNSVFYEPHELDQENAALTESDGFDEESNCSWVSENLQERDTFWRDWRSEILNYDHSTVKPPSLTLRDDTVKSVVDHVTSLSELSAKVVAAHIPFAVVENYQYPKPIPEDIQLKITFWSFPKSEKDIRLYSCLANGGAEEYKNGESLYRAGCVKEAFQIGFHLSGVVRPPQSTSQSPAVRQGFRASVVFDRQRITATNCTCDQTSWCQHIVSLCLHRINQASQVKQRAPISDSLSRLDRDQLQKFAQYLIHELQYEHILPTAQHLLDELLSTSPTLITTTDGAPDPTAGAEGDSTAAWHMDHSVLHENIKKTLVKFCIPSPVVYGDLSCLSSTAPPAAAEYMTLLRPLRARDPEGLNNLQDIIRELLKQRDNNAVPLLEILTDEMLQCDQLLVWWFSTKMSAAANSSNLTKNNANHMMSASSSAAMLCDDIVNLWRLVALNPALSPLQRDDLRSQLETWHIMTLDKVRTAKCNTSSRKDDIELFPGFKPAYEATQIDWSDYTIDGVTFNDSYGASAAVPGVTCLTHDNCSTSKISPVTNYKVDDSKLSFAGVAGGYGQLNAALNVQLNVQHNVAPRLDESSSSEGFSEPEVREDERAERDSDWSDEGIKLHKDGYIAADDDSDADMAAGFSVKSTDSKDLSTIKQDVNTGIDLNYASGLLSTVDSLNTISLTVQSRVSDEPNYFSGMRKWEDEREILFARNEALHAHGYREQACQLACRLANDLLPNKNSESQPWYSQPNVETVHQQIYVECYENTVLARTKFLCEVLSEDAHFYHLAFQIGLYGLLMDRQPAVNKALEVKLDNSEYEIVGLLKQITPTDSEVSIIRTIGELICQNKICKRGVAHLPLMLSSFIYDSLCHPTLPAVQFTVEGQKRLPRDRRLETPSDSDLGFDTAVQALGLKADISEAQHPLICEGTRRQKSDLAISLMVQYKDDQYRLDKILEKLLDKEIHQLFKAPPISSYLTPGGNPVLQGVYRSASGTAIGGASGDSSRPQSTEAGRSSYPRYRPSPVAVTADVYGDDLELDGLHKDMERRLRCGIVGRLNKRPSVGMAAIDSSAPETTSSDNSPTTFRRPFMKQTLSRTISDSESGQSSDSASSTSSKQSPQPTHLRQKMVNPGHSADSPSFKYLSTYAPDSRMSNKSLYNIKKSSRVRVTPTEPNQPSEALAHFMFELAKTLLAKAGGSSSTLNFTHRDNNSQMNTHRLLHICAFQVGLYALGINNCVSKNWLSRTYSSHVSWITGQAMEIGSVAIHILIDTWEGHLTPTEVANLTDKASRGRDPNTIRAAAELALSCLNHAQALNPQETRRAILQCKEQSGELLEKACQAVESAAKDGGVAPEVLFEVAKRWLELYEENRPNAEETCLNSRSPSVEQFRPPTSSPQLQQQMNVPPPGNSNMSAFRPTLPSSVPISQQSAIPIYSTYLPCYPAAAHYTATGQVQPMQQTAFMGATIPIQYSSFSMNQMHAATNIYHVPTTLYTGQGHQVPATMVTMTTAMNPTQMVQNNQQNTLLDSHDTPTPLAQSSEMYNYVLSAFRVGMLAVETYGRRISDERPQAKYNKNPACGEDIKWLLSVAVMLGPQQLQQFCQHVVNYVYSPFILYDMTMEVARAQTRNNQAQLQAALRSPILHTLMQRCLQMFMQCSHSRIHHIQAADYDEFVNIIITARKAFQMMPNGMIQFQELLQGLRRNKSCKKELWTRMMAGLNTSLP